MEEYQSPMTDKNTPGGTGEVPGEVNVNASTSGLQSSTVREERSNQTSTQQVSGGEIFSLGTPPIKVSQYLAVVAKEQITQKVLDTFDNYAEELTLRKKRGKKESDWLKDYILNHRTLRARRLR